MKHLKLYEEYNGSISEDLAYHLTNSANLMDNVFRYGSEKFMNLINEARDKSHLIELDPIDEDLLSTDIGRKGIYEGEEVWLDMPFEAIDEAEYRGKDVELGKPKRGGKKAYYVYVKNDKGNVIKVSFGSGMKAKINDPEARERYNKRHGCAAGKHNDKTKAGYWSCRLPRYAKQLGLSGGGKWW